MLLKKGRKKTFNKILKIRLIDYFNIKFYDSLFVSYYNYWKKRSIHFLRKSPVNLIDNLSKLQTTEIVEISILIILNSFFKNHNPHKNLRPEHWQSQRFQYMKSFYAVFKDLNWFIQFYTQTIRITKKKNFLGICMIELHRWIVKFLTLPIRCCGIKIDFLIDK